MFIDYLSPTAADLCDFVVGHGSTPSPFTLVGTKGMGEGCGTPLPAIANTLEGELQASNISVTISESHNSLEQLWRAVTGRVHSQNN
jgi:Aerobic-type carbon monoxide dehydrogenase, large subunit CoxL/CutL homologs